MNERERQHPHVIPSPQLSLSQQSWTQQMVQNIHGGAPPRTSQGQNIVFFNKHSFGEKPQTQMTTQKSSAGLGPGGSQSNFLKAYSSTVRWYPLNKDRTKSEASLKTVQEIREKNLRDTISKVKNFQFHESRVKSNQFHLGRIDQQIDKKIQKSLKNTEKAQKLQMMEIDHYMNECTDSEGGLLSVEPSREPTPQLDQARPDQIHIENQIDPVEQINPQIIKAGTFRTASKLKELMMPAMDIKLKYQKKKQEYQTIREVNQRSELAQEILLSDKKSRHSILNGNQYNRDISFKQDNLTVGKNFLSTVKVGDQAKQTSHLNISPSSFYSQNFTLRPTNMEDQKYSLANQDNLGKFPRNLESLKEIQKGLNQNAPVTGLGKAISHKSLRRIPQEYFIKNQSLKDQQVQASPIKKVQEQLVLTSLEEQRQMKDTQIRLEKEVFHNIEKEKEKNKKIQEDLLVSFNHLKLSSRVDTIALEEWMSQMLGNIQKEYQSEKASSEERTALSEKYEMTQFIYNLAFVEISKQVSVECYERGILLNQIWQAVLSLMAEQLKLLNGEKNILERRTILDMEKFHEFYEYQMNLQREAMMKMYKESLNYKRSYERLSKDFDGLKEKTQKLGQKLQEVTILYKQQYTKVDFLQRNINNLQGVIQALQGDDQDEDPALGNDYFFQEGMEQERDLGEFLVVGQLSIEEQFNHLDVLGKDLQGFLENTEEKRDKEQAALQDAQNFTTEMMGEFFAEAETAMDGFNEFLLKEGMNVEVETQLVKEDLIDFYDKGLLMNDDIMFEDIGYDGRAGREQEFLAKIAELEETVQRLGTDIVRANLQHDLKDQELKGYKQRVEALEVEVEGLTLENNLKQELIDNQSSELMQLREDLVRSQLKIDKQKDHIQTLQQENQELNYQIVKQNQMMERGPEGNESFQAIGRKKRRSAGFQGSSDEDDSMQVDQDDEKGHGEGKRRKLHSTVPVFNLKTRDKSKFQFAEFNLGYRKERKKRQHPSDFVFQKFLKKKSIQNIMPKTLLLKSITQTYSELSELAKNNQQMPPLIPYIYDSLMNKYGIKKIGTQKFKQLLGSTVRLSGTSFRIAMFGRLMRLVKPAFDNNDIKMYIQVLRYLQNLNIGVKIDNQEGEEAHIVPFVRANECLKTHFEGKIPIDEWTDCRKKVENLKKPDPRNMNKGGVVEIDELIEVILNQYHRLEVLAAEKVHELFLATDFNNNGFISVDEFTVSYRNVAQDNLGKEYAYLLFQDYMEEAFDQESQTNLYGISIDSFLLMAMEFDILKVRDQNLFLPPLYMEKQYQDMITQLVVYRPVWEQRLSKIGLLNEEWKENFYFFSKDIKEESLPKRVLMLRFKLIDAETQELFFDHFISNYFPSNLNAFAKLGVDNAYTSDYSARNQISMEELVQMKKLAGIKNEAKEPIKEEEEGKEEDDKKKGKKKKKK